MSKLSKKNTQSDIQTYTSDVQSISEMFDFIESWLPRFYTNAVDALLDEADKVDPAYIRQVKKERIHNTKIVNAMYRVAKYNAAELKGII